MTRYGSWQRVGGGAIRFWGERARQELAGLLRGDGRYTFHASPWGAGYWIDVYPQTVDDELTLLELLRGCS